MMNTTIAKITVGARRDSVALIDVAADQAHQVLSPPPPTPTTSVQIEPNGSVNVDYLNDGATRLRAKLRFFFMSPCWKWHLKRQFPWKAWFQFVKIIILTTQLILFGIERESYVIFVTESNITFHHFFVRNWQLSDETLPYPRASGDFAVFTNYDFVDSIDYAVQRFNNLTNMSVGLFDYHERDSDDPSLRQNREERFVELCMNRFKACEMDPGTHKYALNTETEDVCMIFNATDNFDVEKYLRTTRNETINYCGLNTLTLEFAIHAIQLKNSEPFSLPDCYHFVVTIIFDNNARTGKIRQRLDAVPRFETCQSAIINRNSTWASVRRNLFLSFDCLVLFVTVISFVLCVRSLYVGHRLCREVRRYYAVERPTEPPFTFEEVQVFYSFWYFLMILTDVMVNAGTIIKILILFKVKNNYDAAGLLLGTSSLFCWFGILRYLAFFRKYNLIFVTIRKALPLLLRFLLCTIIMYLGFLFGGWIVLGPYHTKFRTLSSTFETIFALINGDDMYPTFANIETESIYIWIFSEVYMYSFICLFVYVISSLVIALIIDGYDVVKTYYTEGFPKSRLQKFSEEDVPQWSGAQEWQDLSVAIGSKSVCFPCCFRSPRDLSDLIARDTYLTRNAHTFNL